MKIESCYRAVVLYLDKIAQMKRCEIEDIFISNPKNAIYYVVRQSKLEIKIYKRFFDVDMEKENVLKRLYFTALVLKRCIHQEFHEILFKLMLLYIFSFLKKKGVELTEDFKERTLKKIILVVMLDRVEELFGRYGLYFLFVGLLRN